MLYKFLGKANGLETLELLQRIYSQRTLLASNPTTFNDPFEFKFELDLKANNETIRNRYFSDNPSADLAQFESWYKGLDRAKWFVKQETRQQLLQSNGVICFTAHVDNHLLWSHYANDHQGFCLGFDESIIAALPGVEWHGRVQYQHSVPIFRFFYDDPKVFSQKATTYKSSCWSYEEEYRIILDKSGVVNFPIDGLKEIILGCRAYPELRHFASENTDSGCCNIFIMQEMLSAYSLSKQPFKRDEILMTSFF